MYSGFACVGEEEFNVVSGDAVEFSNAKSMDGVAGGVWGVRVDGWVVIADCLGEDVEMEVVASPVHLKVVRCMRDVAVELKSVGDSWLVAIDGSAAGPSAAFF